MGIIILILFLLIIVKTADPGSSVKYDRILTYNDGWYMLKDGQRLPVRLPGVLDTQTGKELIIEHVLPKEAADGSAIVFRSQQQEVKVFVDGRQIYQYPGQEYFQGILPSTWNFIKLPQDSGGKTIQIYLSSPYDHFSGRVSKIYYGNYNALIDFVRGSHIVSYGISLAVGMIGIIMIFLSVIFHKYKIYESELILGCLLAFVSVWMCGESKMPLMLVSSQAQYFLTLLSLSLCPVFFLAYIREKIKGRAETLAFWFLCFTVCLHLMYVILQVFGILSLIQQIGLMHLVLGAALLYGVCMYGKQILKKGPKCSRGEFYCLLLICGAVVIEIIRFYQNNYQNIGMYVRLSLLIYAVSLLVSSIRKVYLKLMENKRLNVQLHDSKIALMMSQIKPHFIYNTLGTIRVLIKTSPDDAYRMVYDFSTYLRANIDSIGNRTKILFSEELKHIKAYINIEKVRFEQRLSVQFDICAEAFYVPPLCVQALVENAIKHGICKKEAGGCVWIRSYETDKCYVIEVEDNGIGFDRSQIIGGDDKSQVSAGIQNISFRLKELFHGQLTIGSECGRGTKAVIELPKMEERGLCEGNNS
ncbi:Inner membrane protein ypdA [uncultured Roseburia sp.]|nr:Inner membrane protein ypdA [uncultured Roseburia sp.]